jgi:hypothetical protein
MAAFFSADSDTLRKLAIKSKAGDLGFVGRLARVALMTISGDGRAGVPFSRLLRSAEKINRSSVRFASGQE